MEMEFTTTYALKKLMSKSVKIQHTKNALIKAMEQALGIVTTACKIVGVDRSTYYKYLKEDKDFREAIEDIDNIALDFAESQLHSQIKDNNTAATIFYLKTKGKNRGYVERQEIHDVTQDLSDWDENDIIKVQEIIAKNN